MSIPPNRVQGWSRLNWLGGILIIVSWHIHFNKLLMPLTPVCCFANYLQGLQFIIDFSFSKFPKSTPRAFFSGDDYFENQIWAVALFLKSTL